MMIRTVDMGLNRQPLSPGNVGIIWPEPCKVVLENGDARHNPYKDHLAMMLFLRPFCWSGMSYRRNREQRMHRRNSPVWPGEAVSVAATSDPALEIEATFPRVMRLRDHAK